MSQKKSVFKHLSSLFQQLSLSSLPDELVERLSNGELFDKSHVNNTILSVRNETLSELEQELSHLLVELHSSPSSNQSRLWTLFTEWKISPKKFVAFLHIILLQDTSGSVTAANCLLNLLQFPGSNVFNVFNPFVYRAVLDTLRKQLFPQTTTKEKMRNVVSDLENDEGDDKNSEPNEVSDDTLVTSDSFSSDLQERKDDEVNFENAISLLDHLHKVVKHFSFASYSDSLVVTIETLTEISRFFHENKKQKGGQSKGQMVTQERVRSLKDLCFAILRSLCHEMHGNVSETIALILKNLIPNISLHFVRVNGPTIPKECQEIRDRTLAFFDELLSESDQMNASMTSSVQVMLQHLCMKVPERAEYRRSAQEVISHILSKLDDESRSRFIRFIGKYSKNKKVAFRLFSVEISIQLIFDFLTQKTFNEVLCVDFSSLLLILLQRSSDKSVHVRAKALMSISSLLAYIDNSPEQLKNQIIENFFGTPSLQLGSSPPQTRVYSKHPTIPKTPTNPMDSASQNDVKSPTLQRGSLLTLLRRRVNDEKATVRKAAIQALEAIARCKVPNATLVPSDLRLFQERCFDRSLAIRKQSLISISELLKHHPTSTQLCEIWVTSVLPLILDPEASIVEKCLSYFQELVIERIIHASNNEDSVWILLNEIDKRAPEITKFLQKICALLGKEKQLPKKLIICLENAITKQKMKSPWFLLSHVAPYCTNHINYSFVLNHWNVIQSQREEEVVNEQCYVLRVIGCIHKNIPKEIVSQLSKNIFEELKQFDRSPLLIQSYIQTLAKLSPISTSASNSWATKLLDECERVLSAVVLPSAGAIFDEKLQLTKVPTAVTTEKLEKYLFTLGEVAQICPKGVSKRLITIVQTIVSSTFEKLNIRSNDTDTVETIPVPPSVRAHGYVTLGKLCLDDSHLAKQCITMFAKELLTSQQHSIIRNNIMIIMCDLCVRYPTLVDSYIPNLAMCLRDENELVRKQALMLLTQLIQEDYIKWKNGALFFRFIVSLVDDSLDVRQYALYCLSSLMEKNKATGNIFFIHFIETLFSLNDYRLHPTYNQFPQTERERLLFSLKGNENKEKRMTIYKFFLEHLTEDQKFSLHSKLCQEILGGVIEGKLELQQAYFVIQDAISILSSKEIKVSHSSGQNKDEETSDEGIENFPDSNTAVANQKLADAKNKILSKIVKKNVMENVVPIVIELKKLLEKHRSPLLGDLMTLLKELVIDYRDEINEILVDKQLIKELEYELQHGKDQRSITPSSTAVSTPPTYTTSATPKNGSGRKTELSSLSVPKLRKRVSMASRSYTPSSGKKKIKNVLSVSDKDDDECDDAEDNKRNVESQQIPECNTKSKKEEHTDGFATTPDSDSRRTVQGPQKADICLPSPYKPQLWTTVSDTPLRFGKQSSNSEKENTPLSQSKNVLSDDENNEALTKNKPSRKRNFVQDERSSPQRKKQPKLTNKIESEDEIQSQENRVNSMERKQSNKQSKRKRMKNSVSSRSQEPTQDSTQISVPTTRRTRRTQHK